MSVLLEWLSLHDFTVVSYSAEICRFHIDGKESIVVAYKGKFVLGTCDFNFRPPYDTIQDVIMEISNIYSKEFGV